MKVALIGTGLMGRPMAERLLVASHELVVWNRTREKTEPLEQLGAHVAATPGDAVREATCIILMLTNVDAIRAVLCSEPYAALSDRTVIQMGTIGPSESLEMQRKIEAAGGEYMEAPVLGSIPEAAAGKLLIMVGASETQFDRWLGLLKCFGPSPRLIGPVGRAAALKLALNQLIASFTGAFALSLGLVARRGVGIDDFMEILRGSALYTPTFDKKLDRMHTRQHDTPNFPAKHLLKDVDLILEEARTMRLETVGVEGIRALLAMTVTKGWADSDYSAMYEVISPRSAEWS